MTEGEPKYFDELESAADKMRDLWEGDHTHVQNARLVYDMLLQFDREGRLVRELRQQPAEDRTRPRYFFSLK